MTLSLFEIVEDGPNHCKWNLGNPPPHFSQGFCKRG